MLKIFQTLVDRKGNLDKLSQPTVEPSADLVAQKANVNKQVSEGYRYCSSVVGLDLQFEWLVVIKLIKCSPDTRYGFTIIEM